MQINQNISFDILDLVKTTKERVQFMTSLDNLANITFTKEKDIDDAINICLPYWKKDPFLKLFKIFSPEPGKIEKFHDFVLEIKNSLASISEVSLTLAFEPTYEMISSISAWFVMKTKKPVLLDIHIDPKIIGGAAVAYKGKYKDFSVYAKLRLLSQ